MVYRFIDTDVFTLMFYIFILCPYISSIYTVHITV